MRPELSHRYGSDMRWAMIAVLLLGLAACRHTPAPGVSLTVVPDVLRRCEPGAVVTVHWSRDDPGAGHVHLRVRNVGEKPKLWLQAEPTGTATTGPWVSEGFTIFLEDVDGTLLARTTLAAEDC